MPSVTAMKTFRGLPGESGNEGGVHVPGDSFEVDDDRRRDLARNGLIEVSDEERLEVGGLTAPVLRLDGDPEEKMAQELRNKEALAGANKAMATSPPRPARKV